MEKSDFSSTFALAFIHEVRGDPVTRTFLLLRLGKMNYCLLLTNKKFVL